MVSNLDWLNDPGTPEPGRSLTPYRIIVQTMKPFYLVVKFVTQDHALFTMRDAADASLTDYMICAGDTLIFDRTKTEARDGAIVLVRDGNTFVARVMRRTGERIAFYAEGHPTLLGARRIYGTLAGVVRAYDTDTPAAEGTEIAGRRYGLGDGGAVGEDLP